MGNMAGLSSKFDPTKGFPGEPPKGGQGERVSEAGCGVCTTNPFREPPVRVVNIALSVMAYEYPMKKLLVNVWDVGGSQLTLFAFMEAAKFAKHCLPYCSPTLISTSKVAEIV
ncbi:hypothetical protein L2E82_46709 [Cichorium intybus]|uniref:Uncharacterized protein n=1 Tax=Cichorium intybus TaxID=13427 RepID=A0ACB8YU71_CICIN|nr:hypothetical protein L2E82_46709 [Cichorium intybus]